MKLIKFFSNFLRESQNKIPIFLNSILKGGDVGRESAKMLQFKINPLLLMLSMKQDEVFYKLKCFERK